MSDDILEHYGKKGMKWGVRKARKTGSKAKKSAKNFVKVAKEQHRKDIAKAQERDAKIMKFAKTKVSALNTPQNKKRINDGRKLVTQMLKTAGKQKAQALITKGVSDAVDVGIAKAKR